MAKDPGRVLIFDTTLRDGEQSPGASLNLEEKLAIAQQLARLGVDVIEAGFPFASSGDFAAVQKISEHVGGEEGPIICGLSRASKPDIKACADAITSYRKSKSLLAASSQENSTSSTKLLAYPTISGTISRTSFLDFLNLCAR